MCYLQVSAGAAYGATGVFVARCFWQLMGGAIAIIAWLNLRYPAALPSLLNKLHHQHTENMQSLL